MNDGNAVNKIYERDPLAIYIREWVNLFFLAIHIRKWVNLFILVTHIIHGEPQDNVKARKIYECAKFHSRALKENLKIVNRNAM